MPGPYGSVANPVVLDPFRRVTGVHWGKTVTHIIARASYEYFVHVVHGGPCSPPTAGQAAVFHNPQLEFRNFAVSLISVLEGDTWVSIKPDMEIVAPPTGPSDPVDFAAWAMVYWGTATSEETVPPPWQPDDSAAYSIDPNPSLPLQIPLQQKTAVSFEHLGELTDGSPFCTTSGGGTEGVEVTHVREAVHTMMLDFSGTTVTYKGKTFNPVAIGTSEPEAFAYEAWRGSGSVYVIFEKEVVTP